MNAEFQLVELRIPAEMAGERLDAALARLLPEQSRTRIKGWIESGAVQVARQHARPSDRVVAGSRVTVQIAAQPPQMAVAPEQIALNIVYQDRDCLVIDKPAGLVVHPGAGNPRHTLQNALLGLDPSLAALPRAGLIHRLDKDTSGLLVVARTAEAQTSLSRQLMARTMAREYRAVCAGVMTGGGTIDAGIGRHRTDRLRMAVRDDGRSAITHYRILERYRAHTLVEVRLETGRTHQIRLHLSHLRYPIVGDPVYGGRFARPRGAPDELVSTLREFGRQALHAARLSFEHPRSGKRRTFDSPLPADFQALVDALRADAAAPRESR
ncbi:MAG: 23S rRNA pseudouridine(1911/1915/1917) synthase RluD [Steroidobacterales bacterium]